MSDFVFKVVVVVQLCVHCLSSVCCSIMMFEDAWRVVYLFDIVHFACIDLCFCVLCSPCLFLSVLI